MRNVITYILRNKLINENNSLIDRYEDRPNIAMRLYESSCILLKERRIRCSIAEELEESQ
jgi:hypothetical protein